MRLFHYFLIKIANIWKLLVKHIEKHFLSTVQTGERKLLGRNMFSWSTSVKQSFFTDNKSIFVISVIFTL